MEGLSLFNRNCCKINTEMRNSQKENKDVSHRDNFGNSLETLSAVESQWWVSF
jgi:hypothetical protein